MGIAMQTLLATLAVFLVVMAAMAVGVLLGGRRLSGSCGGVPGKDCTCSTADRKACETRAVQSRAAHAARDGLADAVDDAFVHDSRRHLDVWDEGKHEGPLR